MKSLLFALLAGVSLALSQMTAKFSNATTTQYNPSEVTWVASMPIGNGIQGHVVGVSNLKGIGVNFDINFFHFPNASEGPFPYHIHVNPVPSDGNCSATLGHLDPYHRGENPACNISEPEICQAGDLSGKHGVMSPLPGSAFQFSYFDYYLSSKPEDDSFIGNRSVVIHSNNKTRLACANFELAAGSPPPTRVVGGSSSSASASASATSTSGGAVARFVNVGAMLAGVGGLVAFAL